VFDGIVIDLRVGVIQYLLTYYFPTMNKQKTQKWLRIGALLVPTLCLTFINIGTLRGDSSATGYYYTPATSSSDYKIMDDYAKESVYHIDLNSFEFSPSTIQITKDDHLLQDEELAEDEHQSIYEIDLKRMPEGIYKITISDDEGNEVTERIAHKTN